MTQQERRHAVGRHELQRAPDTPVVNTPQVVQNGRCLDPSVSTTDGANPYMWACVPSAANHQWVLEPLGSNTYAIRSPQNGMCLDSGLSTTDGARPYLWTCVPTAPNHQWRRG